jgi:RNA polymerase sigma-70 factor (ECF subfamily)
MTILRNVFLNEMRRVRRTETPLAYDDTLHARAHADTHRLEADLAAVQRAFDRLGDEHREILHLIALEEFTYVEAASALSVPIGTVRSRLSRARTSLREMVFGSFGADSPTVQSRLFAA